MSDRKVVAVTGATGFIGQALIHSLVRAGLQPRLLVRRFPRGALRAGQPVEIVLGDLDEPASLEKLLNGADAVIHLAGLIKASNAAAFFAANAQGTERLLTIAGKINPKAAFLHVSSLAAREPSLSPYAASKRAGEEKVGKAAGGRPWLILRPPAVYGPGDPATLPLFQAATLGFVPYPAAPLARFSLIHVADLAEAITRLTETLLSGSGLSGKCFEVDDGYPGGYQWPHLIAALRAATGRQVRSYRLPRWLMSTVAQLNGVKVHLTGRAEVLMPHKVAELYHGNWVAEDGALPADVRWRPEFDLTDGFQDTLRWYRLNSWVR
ncbi:NAD-dependent epimerase/dehydratase family protein [Dongia soli]|uniref:NAD-dependent epimerase/dehydratase family protein n=1 Tax=Dongia soli TaxID=600628 RepID=A0ABU5E9W4_9PROT|nr:NAD-dependent epimerase/dehydratase family protein [Dongia soli]MDY0883135.1 NAD-dependent epimerase/dehydratase family protein [Dongia soli]